VIELPACFCLLAYCLAAQPQFAQAQMDMGAHAMETQNELPPEQLPAPREMSGVGNVQMKITATPEAQRWFNQGLNLLHDFWDYEAARAFKQGVRVDPQCAMCYWGLYKAESFYHSIAQGYAAPALSKAVALKKHVSKRERLYIEATELQERARKSSAPGPVFSQTVALWRRLVKEHPKDTEARMFLAGVVDPKEAVAILESILKENPENSAANHAYIHALEPTEHPEQALHSAEILASLAPASGHMVHMPGHIYFRLGDYARAEKAFTASMQVDERYMREQHVAPDNDWNYVHNLMYAITNLMEEGKLESAATLSSKLNTARGKLESTLYTYSPRDSVTRVETRLPVALRTANWYEVLELLKASTPPRGRPNLDFLARQLGRFAAGMQAIEKHDLVKAEEESTRFDAELWRASQQLKTLPGMLSSAAASGGVPKLQIMPDALLDPLVRNLSIMSLELRASLSAVQGNIAVAKKLFARARQEEKGLGYREPPGFIRPVGETEGAAMMAAGNWAEAKAGYQQALEERPRSGFALYGIAMSSEKSGDAAAAAKQYAEFLAAWKDADQTLGQMTHARTYVAEHRS
jgi:tetratricopeptide (TPR) repeat protein